MSETVFIQLHPDLDGQADWLLVDSSNEDRNTTQSGQLTEVGTLPPRARIVVFIPGIFVTTTAVETPTRNRNQLLRAIPYILEDQLISDVDQLHFALGNRDEQQRQVVAIINHQQMEQILALLTEAKIAPHQLIPDYLNLPLDENAWSIQEAYGLVQLRTGTQAGLSFDPDHTALILETAANEATEPPTQIDYFGSAENQLHLSSSAELNILEHQDGLSPLERLATGFDQRNQLNLLQGIYNRSNPTLQLWRTWRVPVILLACLFIIKIISLAFEANQLEQQRDELKQSLEKIYRSTFPEAKRVVNPKAQMNNRLNQLLAGNASNQTDFIILLGEIAPIIAQTPGSSLQAIHFTAGRLNLDLQLDKLQTLDILKQNLSKIDGLKVEIISAASERDHVRGRIRIEKQ